MAIEKAKNLITNISKTAKQKITKVTNKISTAHDKNLKIVNKQKLAKLKGSNGKSKTKDPNAPYVMTNAEKKKLDRYNKKQELIDQVGNLAGQVKDYNTQGEFDQDTTLGDPGVATAPTKQYTVLRDKDYWNA